MKPGRAGASTPPPRQLCVALQACDTAALAEELCAVGRWEYEPAQGNLTWSAQTHRIFGTAEHDFSPSLEGFLERVHADDRPRVVRSLLSSRSRSGDHAITHRIKLAGGGMGFVELRWRWVPGTPDGPQRAIGICRDCTHERQMEQALRLSERRFRRTFQDAAIGIAVTGIDGRFLEANAAFCHMLGYSIGELRGLDQWTVTDEQDRGRDSMALHELLAGSRNSFDTDKRYRGKSGALVWCRASVSVVRDEQRRNVSVVHVAQDITAEHEGRLALQATEARLDFALKAAGVGYWDRDLAAGTAWRSPRHDACFGYAEPLAQWSYQTFLAHVHPDDRDHVDRMYRQASRQRTTDHANEFRVVWPDGSTHWLMSVGRFSYDADNMPRRVAGIVFDIGDRKRAEQGARESAERFRILADATHDAVWDWDLAHERVWWSEGFADLFGYVVAEIGSSPDVWRDGIHPDDRQRVIDSIDAFLAGSDDRWQGRYSFRRADGSYAQVSDQARVLRDAQGRAVRMVGGMVDVSERLALEERLRQAQRLEAVGQFTGGMAHDFNNLLTVVLGNIEVLHDRLTDPADRELTEMVANAAQRGADLTHRMLAFARKQPLDPQAVDIHAFIDGMRHVLQRAVGDGISVEIKGGGPPLVALVDPAQLESAMLNLGLNARDAMAGCGRLSVASTDVELDATYCALQADLQPGSYVQIAVSDTGCGIAAEHMERIFEPFFTTKETGKGTGLGLAMIWGFAKQSGGHVLAVSEPGYGTTIKLLLPPANYLPAVSEPESDTVLERGGEHLLLVDDDELVRQYAAGQLRDLGYTVHVAGDARHALEMLEMDGAIDLLLTDVVMPGMNGRELARAACQMRPGLKVLYCTGSSEPAATPRDASDAELILPKPYGRYALARFVRLAIDGAVDSRLPNRQ